MGFIEHREVKWLQSFHNLCDNWRRLVCGKDNLHIIGLSTQEPLNFLCICRDWKVSILRSNSEGIHALGYRGVGADAQIFKRFAPLRFLAPIRKGLAQQCQRRHEYKNGLWLKFIRNPQCNQRLPSATCHYGGGSRLRLECLCYLFNRLLLI